MRRTIFYSWQSDLPNATNRSLIQQALENAAKTITVAKDIDVEPVVDRDTQGVSGAPDIAKTIFEKINTSDVFVADVSIIGGSRKGRPTPNPNVLVELGYAIRALGEESVILVFNVAFGKLEQLPFDLKMRRVIPYNMPESSGDRATERRTLEGRIESAVRSALNRKKPSALVAAPDIGPRSSIHKAWATAKLENTSESGHLGIYCLPFGSIQVPIPDLTSFVQAQRHRFSESLQHAPQLEPLQNGISLGYYPRLRFPNAKSTVRTTLYRDGLVALDAQFDRDLGRPEEMAKTIHVYWLAYELQRHFQLAKAILSSHGASQVRTVIELNGIETLSLAIGAAVAKWHGSTTLHWSS